MNTYARFRKDIKDNDGNIIFKENPKKFTKKTRYAVVDEDEEGRLYIAQTPNDVDCNIVTRFSADCEGLMFNLVEE